MKNERPHCYACQSSLAHSFLAWFLYRPLQSSSPAQHMSPWSSQGFSCQLHGAPQPGLHAHLQHGKPFQFHPLIFPCTCCANPSTVHPTMAYFTLCPAQSRLEKTCNSCWIRSIQIHTYPIQNLQPTKERLGMKTEFEHWVSYMYSLVSLVQSAAFRLRCRMRTVCTLYYEDYI